MKAAIECSEKFSTVSPRYAEEIKDPFYAHGLDPVSYTHLTRPVFHVRAQHFAVIHFIDMIARKNEHVFGIVHFDKVDIPVSYTHLSSVL